MNQRTTKQRELNNVLAPVRPASVVDSAKLSHEGDEVRRLHFLTTVAVVLDRDAEATDFGLIGAT